MRLAQIVRRDTHLTLIFICGQEHFEKTLGNRVGERMKAFSVPFFRSGTTLTAQIYVQLLDRSGPRMVKGAQSSHRKSPATINGHLRFHPTFA